MGPKLKKPPRNSYSFFLDDYVASEARRGRNISKKVAAEECAPLWKKLTEAEKQPYVERAKADKEKEKYNKDNKFTSLGLSYTQKEKLEKKEAEAIARMDIEINDTIDGLLPGSTLKTHLFYLVHVNYYCKTTEGMYVPAELAISQFNLLEGVRDTYHILIDPGRIPTGYRFDAQKSSDEIHSLPLPPYDEGEKDYLKILDDIRLFMKPGRMPNGKLPPLYTIENNLKASQSVMKWITEAEGDYPQDYELFRVYPIDKLFFKLKNRCVGREHQVELGFPTRSLAIAEIDKDFFCYTVGISCAFHKNHDDKYQNCSLSFVQRLVYMICDHCCHTLGIDLIPGRHSQLYCDTKRSSTRGSTISALSSASSTGSRSVCGDNESEFGTTASSYASSIKGHIPSSKGSLYESSKKDLEPLKLPKTTSRAFKVVASDVSDMESVISGGGDSIASYQDFEGAAALPNGRRVKQEVVDDDDDDDEPPMYCMGRGSQKKRSVPQVGRNSFSHEDKKGPRGRGRPIYDPDDSD